MTLSERDRAETLVHRYGWNATSFQVLGPGFRYWFSSEAEGLVAYVEAGGSRVVAGAPICDAANLARVAAEFAREARAARRSVIFFACERRLIQALAGGDWDWTRIGLQACWDPRTWSAERPATVASQIRRAARKGVEAREIGRDELGGSVGAQMQALVTRWNARHRMAPMQFLVALDSLAHTEAHRYFAAFRGDEIVGLLVAIPVYARAGWMLENLIVEVGAPNGTGESLVDMAMRAFEGEQASYTTMGLVALAGLDAHPAGEPVPAGGGRLRKTLLNGLLHRAYRELNWLYGFRGLYAFRSKFKPRIWEPIFAASDAPIGVRTFVAILLAFMGDRPLAFVARTFDRLLHRLLEPSPREIWAGISAFLAAALVPWIFALLAADGAYWFGTAWLARAWAFFDVPVAVAFGALAIGVKDALPWARPLARVLLGVVLADTWLTATQAILYNWPRLEGGRDTAVVLAGVAAPALAAMYLVLLIRFVNLEQEREG